VKVCSKKSFLIVFAKHVLSLPLHLQQATCTSFSYECFYKICFRCIVSWISLYCLLGFVVLSLGFRCIVSWASLYCLLDFVVLYLVCRCIVWLSLYCLLGFVVLSLGFRCIVSWVSLHCLLGFVVLSLELPFIVSWISLYCILCVVILFGFCCIVSWVSLHCLLVFVEVGGGGGGGRGGICRQVPRNYSLCDKYNDDKENGFHYLIFYHEYSMLKIFSSPWSPPPLIFVFYNIL
jgi:hypothetical protein